MTTDSYLSTISSESLEVLAHFGPEAPHKLNTYACSLEDALLESLEKQRSQAEQIRQYTAYVEKAQRILSDPDALLDYVKGFFGPEGPYPGMAMITRTPNAATCHG
jgi:hypothetical protein